MIYIRAYNTSIIAHPSPTEYASGAFRPIIESRTNRVISSVGPENPTINLLDFFCSIFLKF